VSRHLHDSVLQTLALIQREAERPDEVRTLARSQERALREWLFGGSPPPSGFASSLRSAAADVEARYRAPIEVVVVGDHDAGPGIEELVAAATEAMVNAVRHAGSVTVYGESDPSGVRVFVRDRGDGFDPDAVPSDRHGIRDSIAGRMEQAGGRAELRTRPGGPTEWRLEVPA
jgi:signal transduction histidine kinase